MVRAQAYKRYRIEVIATHDGRWKAKVTRSDGKLIKVLYGPKDEVPTITTGRQSTEQDAVAEAKRLIDGGGLCFPEL